VRILVAGDWHSELHEVAVYNAFRKLGHEVGRFSWHEYFHPQGGFFRGIDSVIRKFQNKFVTGPLLTRVNRDFVAAATAFRPELVFVYRGTHITAASLAEVKRRIPGVFLFGYNNDDPFGPDHPGWLWRHFMRAIPYYDLVGAYRKSNLVDFEQAGARRVRLLRSWFIEERNHPVVLSDADRSRYECDVVFVGHYEPDGRVEMLERIVNAGFRLRLFGPGYYWDPVIAKTPTLAHLYPIRLVWGEDYNRSLCGAKVALCFLSKLNRDAYTRRCFEIPATQTVLLSEYSDDLATLFREGIEADFFRTVDELIAKIGLYVGDDARRGAVAAAGHARVYADRHDVVSRMAQLMEWVAEIRTREAV